MELTGRFRNRTIWSLILFPLSFKKKIIEVEIKYTFINYEGKEGVCTTWRKATKEDKIKLII